MPRPRLIAALTVTAALCGAGSLAGTVSPAAAAITSHESGVHFTSKTVTVSRATVRENLIGISPSGTFKFKRAAGSLARLRPGKVMLLQGADAVLVKSISHSHGRFLVNTKPAALTDVISSGHIAFSGAPNFDDAIMSKVNEPTASAASDAFAAPGYPYVGGPPTAFKAGAPSFAANGESGLFGYSITFTPASPTRLNVSGTICFLSVGICANGRSNGLSAEVNLSGFVDVGEAAGGINVNGGSVSNSSISIKSFSAEAHITYTVVQGSGATENGDPPVFHIPLTVDYSIPGTIPIYLKLQAAVLLKLGISSKNAVVHGGVEVNTSGSDTLNQSGKSVSGTESGDQIHGQVLDQSDGGVPPSISAAASGVVVALQFPKIGVGVGVTSANGIAYVDLISAVGQTVGSAFAGMFCSSYDINISAGAGLEAQVGLGGFGLSVATPRQTLYETKFATHDPGCPEV